MSRLIFVLVSLLPLQVVACRKSGNSTGEPPPFNPNPSGESAPGGDKPSENPSPTPTATPHSYSNWQTLKFIFKITTAQHPRPAVLGFDQVVKIFSEEKYGPCIDCHRHEWPYLSSDEWPRFLESLKNPRHSIKTKEELAALILACVDQASETHCAGDPSDPQDNIDFKMPTKFGFDPVTEADFKILQKWIAGGVVEKSQNASRGLVLSDLVSFDTAEITPLSTEVRTSSQETTPVGGSVQVLLDVRFVEPCADGSLLLNLKNQAGEIVASSRVPLLCQDDGLKSEEQINL